MKLSIVIPVYNAYPYLENCIESILNQKFEDFELLLINDGSTDSSLDICRKYECKDKRIRVFDKANSGVSDTRNYGINEIKGDYVLFVDGDDWIEHNTLEALFEVVDYNNPDLIIFGISIDVENETGINSTLNSYKRSSWRTKTEIKGNVYNLFEQALINSSCNKLYKSEVLLNNNIRFKNSFVGEDTEFNLDYLHFIDHIEVLNHCFYHYIKRIEGNSVTSGFYEDYFSRYIEVHKKMKNFFTLNNKLDSDIEQILLNTMVSQYLGVIFKVFKSKNSWIDKKTFLNSGINNQLVRDSLLHARVTSFKEKMFRLLIANKFYLISNYIYILITKKGKKFYEEKHINSYTSNGSRGDREKYNKYD